MKTISLLLLLLTFGCGGGSGGGYGDGGGNGGDEEEAQEPESFSTRLNNQLLVAGEKCDGGEETEANGEVILCQANQYLITIDNINTCTNNGCTEVAVIPIIGDLVISSNGDDFDLFNIVARSPTSASQREVLSNVSVRVESNGDAEVIER